jgi:hypothetical protein
MDRHQVSICQSWLGTSGTTLAIVVLGNLVGLTGTIVLPVFVDGWTESLGLSVFAVGALAGLEGLGLAIGVILATARPRFRPSARLIGRVAAAAALAFAVSALANWIELLAIPRIIAAVLCGIVFAECSRGLATFAHPARRAAIVTFCIALVAAAMVYALEIMRPVVGLSGITLGYAGYLMLLALMLVAIAPTVTTTAVSAAEGRGRHGALLLIAFAGCVISDQGVYAFSHRFAANAGVGHDSFAAVLGLSSATAPLGALLALTHLARRADIAVPIALIIKASAVIALIGVADANGLLAAMTISSTALYFTTPLLMGLAALFDSSGRLVALAGGTILLSTALGPLAAGALLQISPSPGGIGRLSMLAATCCVLASLCVVAATRPQSPSISNDKEVRV